MSTLLAQSCAQHRMKGGEKKSDFHTSEAGQGGNVTARQTDAEANWFYLSELGGRGRNWRKCVRGLIFQIKNNNFPYQN